MSILSKLLEIHDRWLYADSARVKPWMSTLLGLVGASGLAMSLLSDTHSSKWLAAISGFAIGVAAEKFAQVQILRVRRKFSSSASSGTTEL